MPLVRLPAILFAIIGLLLSVVSPPATLAAAALTHHRPLSSHGLRVHRTYVVPPDHPSLRVVKVRHRTVVRAHGIVRRARAVPWADSAPAAADGGARRDSRTRRGSAIQLTAYAGSGGAVTEYPVPTPNSSPQGVAVTPDGSAWFVESNANNVGHVVSGGPVTEYPVTGATYGGSPQGITVGADGNLWFTEYSYIGRITPSGVITLFPITRDNYAYDITPGPGGNVWFTEILSTVGYVTPAGAVTEYSIGSGIHPQYITARPDGAVWFTAFATGGGPYLYRITQGGSLTQYVLPSSWTVGDITTGPDGRLWFSSGSTSLTAFSPNGSYTTYTWSDEPPDGYVPEYIRPDGTRALVFTNFYGSALGRMTINGLVSFATVPTNGDFQTGIGVAPDGTVWFADSGYNYIGMLSPGPGQFPPGVPATQTSGCVCQPTSAARPEAYRASLR